MSENDTADWNPAVGGDWVAWERGGDVAEIIAANLKTDEKRRLSDNCRADFLGGVDGRFVTWYGLNIDGEYDVWAYGIGDFSDNPSDNMHSHIDGGRVVWSEIDGAVTAGPPTP